MNPPRRIHRRYLFPVAGPFDSASLDVAPFGFAQGKRDKAVFFAATKTS
ncbi:MAG: hypothetical protein IH847_05000, partial [Acidobacteria bacterium]|nr:hypothetical protein [Acidobacteriota bacterium]